MPKKQKTKSENYNYTHLQLNAQIKEIPGKLLIRGRFLSVRLHTHNTRQTKVQRETYQAYKRHGCLCYSERQVCGDCLATFWSTLL